jgi:hypothetical protein
MASVYRAPRIPKEADYRAGGRAQGIAELMPEKREELVLAVISFAQRLLALL